MLGRLRGVVQAIGQRQRSTRLLGSSSIVDVNKCSAVMCELVEQSSKLMREANKKRRSFETKENNKDLVTETDKQIEKLMVEGLQQHFPDHIYIGEEGIGGASTGNKLSDAPTWIIDPIDGTMNFVHGFHYTCISVGFWLNRAAELAICYNPMLDQRFTARRGRGAFLNGQPLRVSEVCDLERALVMHELNPANMEGDYMNIQIGNVCKLSQKVQGLRVAGSAALNMCLVAMGAADAYYEFYPHAWDLAAGVLLVQEAGGVVMDTVPASNGFDIMSRRVLVAATAELGRQMAQLLGDMQIYHKRDDEQ